MPRRLEGRPWVFVLVVVLLLWGTCLLGAAAALLVGSHR